MMQINHIHQTSETHPSAVNIEKSNSKKPGNKRINGQARQPLAE